MSAGVGTVYGVGLGPGDPELVTMKAVRLIQSADLIAYPAPETGASFARQIASPYLRNGQAELPIRMNIGDGSFPKDDVYDAAADQLAAAARAGRRVVVLCEGDPFFFGSFMYLYARLSPLCPVAVVPGVSALTACAAASGAPLAARNDVLSVIPATLPEADLRQRLAEAESAAIIKVGRHLPKLKNVLAALGLLEKTRYVERATLESERVLDLADVPDHAAPYFSMLLMHRRGKAWQ